MRMIESTSACSALSARHPVNGYTETKPRAKLKSGAIAPDLLTLPKVLFEARGEYPAARWFLDLMTQEA